LAILFSEERYEEAYSYWQNSEVKVSSILLRIETIVALRRMYEHNKSKLEANWLNEKTKELVEYLNEVNYRIINEKLEQNIFLKKELSKCRALDAIHIATALEFRENNDQENINVYSFDVSMHNLAKHFRFKTNQL
jgi:hypothetical protein